MSARTLGTEGRAVQGIRALAAYKDKAGIQSGGSGEREPTRRICVSKGGCEQRVCEQRVDASEDSDLDSQLAVCLQSACMPWWGCLVAGREAFR